MFSIVCKINLTLSHDFLSFKELRLLFVKVTTKLKSDFFSIDRPPLVGDKKVKDETSLIC